MTTQDQLQLSILVRNARLNAIEAAIGTGAILEIRTGDLPATCASTGTGTVLSTTNLPSDWLSDAAGGTKALLGSWQDLQVDVSGTAGYFRVYASDGITCHIQGTITVTGGGGDMEISSVVLTVGSLFTVTSFVLIDANAGPATPDLAPISLAQAMALASPTLAIRTKLTVQGLVEALTTAAVVPKVKHRIVVQSLAEAMTAAALVLTPVAVRNVTVQSLAEVVRIRNGNYFNRFIVQSLAAITAESTAAAVIAAGGSILQVGPGKQYATVTAAYLAAVSGNTIEIDAGTYVNDVPATMTKSLTIRGIGGMAHFVCTQDIANGQGIFLTNGNLSISWCEFSGAQVSAGNGANGAGIRYKGGNLTLTNCYFHDNQNGLLGDADLAGSITMVGSEFEHNGSGTGQTHNCYIGHIATCFVDHCYFHDAVVGHEFKCRANVLTLQNSRIQNNTVGTASYEIDMPDGGNCLIQSNVIQQAASSQNPNMIAFYEEIPTLGHTPNPNSQLTVTGNTIINDRPSSPVGVFNDSAITIAFTANQIWGLTPAQYVTTGPSTQSGNTVLGARPVLDLTHPWLTGAQGIVVDSLVESITTVSPADATLLAQKIVYNTSASAATPTESYITFGFPCRLGSVPAGYRLRVETAAGVLLRSQADFRSSNGDGSLRWCEVSCVLPSIPASATPYASFLVLKVKKELGAFNNTPAPGRSFADVVAATDLKFTLSNLRSFSDAYMIGTTDLALDRVTTRNLTNTAVDTHYWVTGFPVKFNVTAGGVVSGTTYYVKVINSTTLEVYPTALDATNGTNRINLTADLTGSIVTKQPVAHGSGNWTCTLNDASNIELLKSGPVCQQWRGWDYFSDDVGGAMHAHLNGRFYPTVWTKNDGTRGPVSHLSQVHQGWISVPNPTFLMYDALYKNGAATIRDYKSTATIASINLSTGEITTSAPHGWKTKFCVQLQNSGGAYPTCVPKIAPDTTYWVRRVSDTVITLHSTCTGTIGNTARLTFSGAGSGINTIVKSINHCARGAWKSVAEDTLLDWTASEPTVFVVHDVVDLVASGLLPPYDTSVVVSPTDDPTPTVYSPQYVGRHPTALDSTGGSEHIGLIPVWCARALLSQRESYARDARANAYCTSAFHIQVYNETTGRIPTYRGPNQFGFSGDYPGMGANRKNSYWYSDVTHSADWLIPTGGYEPMAPISNSSHWPASLHYTLMTEGGAHLIDDVLVDANFQLQWRLSGTTAQVGMNAGNGRYQRATATSQAYYGIITHFASNIRADAWCMRSMSYGAALCPDSWPERAYLDDIVRDNCAYAVDTINNFGAAFKALGHWCFVVDVATHWMMHFIGNAICGVYKIHQYPDAFTWAKHMSIQPIGYGEGVLFPCTLGIGSYKVSQKYSKQQIFDFIANWSEMWIQTGKTYNSDVATNTFTVRDPNGGGALDVTHQWPLTEGDPLKFAYGNASKTPPTPFVNEQIYYIRNPVNDNTFQLAASPGGTPIVLTQTKAANEVFVRPLTCPTVWRDHDPSGYLMIGRSALRFFGAIGVPGTALAESRVSSFMTADLEGINSNGYSDPQWALDTSYPA